MSKASVDKAIVDKVSQVSSLKPRSLHINDAPVAGICFATKVTTAAFPLDGNNRPPAKLLAMYVLPITHATKPTEKRCLPSAGPQARPSMQDEYTEATPAHADDDSRAKAKRKPTVQHAGSPLSAKIGTHCHARYKTIFRLPVRIGYTVQLCCHNLIGLFRQVQGKKIGQIDIVAFA